MKSLLSWTVFAMLVSAFFLGAASEVPAKTLDRAEIASEMLGKPIYARRFGMSVKMLYRRNGTVSASASLGTVNGTWRYRGQNQVCTTFRSSPAKGTSCVSFRKTDQQEPLPLVGRD